MLIAKIEAGSVVRVADYHEFGGFSTPPLEEQLISRGFKKVSLWPDHNPSIQKLIPCDPVIEGEWVYTVKAVNKTDDDIKSDKAASLSRIRLQRNELLSKSDWTQLPDAPLAEVDLLKWRKYRKDLRDLTKIIVDPRNFTDWPKSPDDNSIPTP